jgi:pyridinium-3,5-bisthiocarboxylic acid mononucleotide nickel chelatase
LLKGFSLMVQGPKAELTTPTGAALVAAMAIPSGGANLVWFPQRIGYGAGTRTWQDFPNVLRAALGQTREETDGVRTEEIITLVTQVDDVTPQTLGFVMEQVLAAGALDASLTPIIMKKGRPGHHIEILCRPEQARQMAELLFTETATLGIRVNRVSRWILNREMKSVSVTGRRARMKVAKLPDGRARSRFEYEDARRIALETGRPLRSLLNNAQHKHKEHA